LTSRKERVPGWMGTCGTEVRSNPNRSEATIASKVPSTSRSTSCARASAAAMPPASCSPPPSVAQCALYTATLTGPSSSCGAPAVDELGAVDRRHRLGAPRAQRLRQELHERRVRSNAANGEPRGRTGAMQEPADDVAIEDHRGVTQVDVGRLG